MEDIQAKLEITEVLEEEILKLTLHRHLALLDKETLEALAKLDKVCLEAEEAEEEKQLLEVQGLVKQMATLQELEETAHNMIFLEQTLIMELAVAVEVGLVVE